MEGSAISISEEAWQRRYTDFPVGMVEACLWLAAVYAIPSAAQEAMKWLNYKLPDGVPRFTPQVLIMSVLAIAFIMYWKLGRRAKLGALGISMRELPRDLAITLVGAVVCAIVYVAVIGAVYVASPWVSQGDTAFRQFVRGAGFSDNSVVGIFMVVVMFPLLEEFWFRGVLFTPLRKEFRRWLAIVFCAVIFAAMHYPSVQIPINQLFGGLVFSWVYDRRRSLVAPVLLHMAGNGSLALVSMLATQWGFK